MVDALRFLIAESETPAAREQRRRRVGESSGESYLQTLQRLEPLGSWTMVCPVESGAQAPDALESYDAVFLTGSPLHLYEDTPAVRRQLDFMRAVFSAGTPAFGSCAGLQVATVAAGGTVRTNARGHEVAFARRITPTEAGMGHGLLAGRPAAFDALAIHSDEVERLPEGATLLATNGVTAVQAAEIRVGDGVFWGVQYHPELPIEHIAGAVRAQAASLVEQGLVRDEGEVTDYADLMDELAEDPRRRDLHWRLGVDEQVADPQRRVAELRNFIDRLVKPRRTARARA